MKTYFETKEQYVAFRQAWATACNSPEAKKQYKDGILYGENQTPYKIREPGILTSVHHLLYAILRGKPVGYGFTPITNKAKLLHMKPNFALDDAKDWICLLIKRANETIIAREAMKEAIGLGKVKSIKPIGWQDARLDEFLHKLIAPFNGTVTVKMIAEIPALEVQ